MTSNRNNKLVLPKIEPTGTTSVKNSNISTKKKSNKLPNISSKNSSSHSNLISESFLNSIQFETGASNKKGGVRLIKPNYSKHHKEVVANVSSGDEDENGEKKKKRSLSRKRKQKKGAVGTYLPADRAQPITNLNEKKVRMIRKKKVKSGEQDESTGEEMGGDDDETDEDNSENVEVAERVEPVKDLEREAKRAELFAIPSHSVMKVLEKYICTQIYL